MSKKKVKQRSPLSKERKLSWYYLIPIIFIVAIIPLITYAKVIKVEGLERVNWKGGETSMDFFSYYKSIYFAVTAFITFIILILLRFTGQFKFKKSKYYIPLAIYIVFVVLSFFNSDDKLVSSRGFIELFQGVWVLIGYALIVFAMINYVQEEKHVKVLVYSYVFVGLATGIIGLGQYFGFDIFKTMWGRYMILPQNMHQIAETLKFTFAKNTIYATMYNTNFVGSFAAILLPLSLAMFMFAKDKKHIIFTGFFMALMSFVWVGCNSRAGYVGVLLSSIFIIILFRKNIKSNIKKLGSILALFIVILVVMNTASDGRVFSQFSRLSIANEANKIETNTKKSVQIDDIIFDGTSVKIVTKSESLKIMINDTQMTFEDAEGKPLAVKKSGDNINFIDEKYFNYIIKMDDSNGRFTVNVYDQSFNIYMTKDGFKMAGSGGVLGTTAYPDRLKFMDGYETFGSSRGYIWSRAIPMMKDTFFVGYGPGMFAIKFPQQDYIGKMIGFNNEAIIVDKPHDMYIQIGIETGVISLLALLSLYLMYFIDSMKLYYRRNITTFLDHIGVGALTGVIAYLGAALFNDQIISVAPLFYVMVGLGIAINTLVKKQPQGE